MNCDENQSVVDNSFDAEIFNEDDFNQDGLNISLYNQPEVDLCLQILNQAIQYTPNYNANSGTNINMEELDGLLPDVASSLYFKLLHESIEKKKFFNKPIKIYEQLLRFKLAEGYMDDPMEYDEDDASNSGLDCDSDEEIEEDIFSFWDLTQNGFDFIVNKNRLIHLTSPAGTGKTMTIWQLAKSIDVNFRKQIVPVAIKGTQRQREPIQIY